MGRTSWHPPSAPAKQTLNDILEMYYLDGLRNAFQKLIIPAMKNPSTNDVCIVYIPPQIYYSIDRVETKYYFNFPIWCSPSILIRLALTRNIFQLILGDPEVFPGQPGDTIPLAQGSGTYGSSGDCKWLADNFELKKKKSPPAPCNVLYRARLKQK